MMHLVIRANMYCMYLYARHHAKDFIGIISFPLFKTLSMKRLRVTSGI